MKKYKIISKTRFYLFLVTVLVLCSVIIMSLVSRQSAHSLSYDLGYHQVEVSEGDTLWKIALDYLPEGTDVRKLIYDINELNNIEFSYIYPGDIIKIPKY